MKAIDKFRKKENLLITFEELEKIPINEVQQLYPDCFGAVEFTRIKSNSENLLFTVSMKEGSSWKSHHHDCVEVILLYKGKLREIYSGRVIDRAQAFEFSEGQEHYVLAEVASVFYVEFKKPQ